MKNKKFILTMILIIALALTFTACPAPTDSGDSGDAGDAGDSGDSGDGGTISYRYEWTQLNPTGTIPDARSRHAMVYNGNNKVILFGGQASGGVTLPDTYEYDISSNTWTEITTTGTPQGETAMGMIYAGNDKVILYGGRFAEQTWELDLTTDTWSNLNPSGSAPERFNHEMLLVDTNKAVTCLGTPTTSLDGDMWEYDISTNTWIDLDTPDPEPTSRFLYSMTYNTDNNKIYLFGGSDSSGTGGSETWEYDVANNTWVQLNPTSPPSARMGHTMAYVGNGIIILFGGESTQSSATQMNDFWVYKVASNTWTMYGLDNDPPVRAAHKWAYIPESNKLIMFSGYNYDGSGYNYMTDTWELAVIEE